MDQGQPKLAKPLLSDRCGSASHTHCASALVNALQCKAVVVVVLQKAIREEFGRVMWRGVAAIGVRTGGNCLSV